MTSSFFSRLLGSPLADEEAFAAAYETLAARQRACCKMLIARLHACLGEERLENDLRHLRLRQGFTLTAARRPAHWALLLWDERCPSPARILAALMPAVLAGVPHILVCRVVSGPPAAPPPPPVLAALELAGQETAISLEAGEAPDFAVRLAAVGKPGCIAVLGSAPWTDGVLAAARARGLPAWCGAAPRIAVCPSAFAAASKEGEGRGFTAPEYGMLRFAQPDAELVLLDEKKDAGQREFSCVVCGPARIQYWLSRSPLALTPGHEWFWLWPDLDREFFMQRRYGVAG